MHARNLLAVVALAASGLVARPALAADGPRFAYVDLGRALGETEDGKRAQARLKTEFDARQKDLDVRQEELKKMKEDLDKKASLLKPEALQKESKAFQDKFTDLQTTYAKMQQDLARKEQEATKDIMDRLQKVVATIGEREHFAMVVERSSAVIWAQSSLDITNEVIRMYNAQSPTPSGTRKK